MENPFLQAVYLIITCKAFVSNSIGTVLVNPKLQVLVLN